MRVFGIMMMIVGALTLLYGLLASGSVSSPGDYGRVVNIGLMGEKLIISLMGTAVFVAGAIFTAGGALLETSRQSVPSAPVAQSAIEDALEPVGAAPAPAPAAPSSWRVVAVDAEEVETDGKRWRWRGEEYGQKWLLKEAIRADRRRA